MKNKTKIIFAVVIIAAAFFAWTRFETSRAPKYTYMTQRAAIGSVMTSVSATGKLSPLETVEVGSQVSGQIVAIYVDYNSPVTEGMLLAELDPDVLTSQVASARASVAAAEAGVRTAEANLLNAQRSHERNETLWKRQLIARSERDATETSLAVAKASLAEARARVAQSREQLRQAETNLGYARIESPINGVVVDKEVEVGQTVAASFSTPTLFSIAKDLSKMRIEAAIDEADIGNIKAGQSADVTFDAWQYDRFTAEVSQIRLSPQTISNVVTYTVILTIDNAELRLLPGMTANINVITERRDDVLRVPAAALRFSPPPEILAQYQGDDEKDEGARTSGGLVNMPRRPDRVSKSGGGTRRVWPVANGKLLAPIEIDEIGVTDRTWVEIRGSAADAIKDGAELAVAFTKTE